MLTEEKLPSVASFYENKTVLITGASGFLGKVILETLLRVAPKVKKIFLIVRSSKDKSALKRVEDTLRSPLFDEVRENDSEFEKKVVALPGELTESKLGLSEEHYQLLIDEVQLIMHSAASVNFNEELKQSLEINVCAVEEVCRLCHQIKDLQAFVHVSTAYSQCNQEIIQEKIYRSTIDTRSILQTLNTMHKESPQQARKTSKSLAKALMHDRPNTYTLTKSIAEDAVYRHAKGENNLGSFSDEDLATDKKFKCLPFAVFRPSVVGCIAGKSTLKNTTEKRGRRDGWVDNLNGPGGLYLASGHNILRVMPGDIDAIVDIVPVDFVANMLLAVVMKVAHTYYKVEDKSNQQLSPFPLVFNCTSGATNPLKIADHNRYGLEELHRNPVEKNLIIKPSFFMVKNRFDYEYIWRPICHHLPGMIMDLGRILMGKKPIMARIYRKLHSSVDAYAYFSSHEWKWEVDNVRQLSSQLTEEDRKTLNFDFSTLDWRNYITLFVKGSVEFAAATKPVKSIQKSSSFQSAFITLAILFILVAALFTLFFDVFVDPTTFNLTNSSLPSAPPTFMKHLFSTESD